MKKLLLSLLCLQLLSIPAFAETTAIITNPTHKDANLPLSLKSNANGVCRYFGFERALPNSVMKATYMKRKLRAVPRGGEAYKYVERALRSESIILNEDGNAVDQIYSKSIASITCINP